MKDRPKVLVIGLDGVTWDLIKPWAEEGKLLNIKQLMYEEVWGVLDDSIEYRTSMDIFNNRKERLKLKIKELKLKGKI